MKPTTFNFILSLVLLSLVAVNLAFASREQTLHASVPLCGGIEAPTPNCTCCEESQTWYCQ